MFKLNYFKKKLSNSEQVIFMKDLKEIDKSIEMDKPYRLLVRVSYSTDVESSSCGEIECIEDYGTQLFISTLSLLLYANNITSSNRLLKFFRVGFHTLNKII